MSGTGGLQLYINPCYPCPWITLRLPTGYPRWFQIRRPLAGSWPALRGALIVPVGITNARST
jgi:hypothetical protein